MYNRISEIDLNELLLFHELGKASSLKQASVRLKVPLATVSRKLRELEKDLGAVLVKRGARRIALTDAGVAIYEHCERIVAEVAAAHQAVQLLQTDPGGEIRISLPYGFGTNWISSAVAKFAKVYPKVELRIRATYRTVDVTTEQIDVAFHVGHVGNELLPALKICELHRGVYASTAYCNESGIPGKPAELLRHACIPLESQLSDGLWTFRTGNRKVKHKARITVSDVGTAYQMVLGGHGYAILPNVICKQALLKGELQRVLQDWAIPPLDVTAIFLERRHLPLRIRAFLDMIGAEARKLTMDK
ncbi:MAG: LysR substrate-binding domain-containing protein [Steroidobacteraceae bacterium]